MTLYKNKYRIETARLKGWDTPINQFTPQSKNLASVIRNEKELNRVREYILNNPENWAEDDNYILEACQ